MSFTTTLQDHLSTLTTFERELELCIPQFEVALQQYASLQSSINLTLNDLKLFLKYESKLTIDIIEGSFIFKDQYKRLLLFIGNETAGYPKSKENKKPEQEQDTNYFSR